MRETAKAWELQTSIRLACLLPRTRHPKWCNSNTSFLTDSLRSFRFLLSKKTFGPQLCGALQIPHQADDPSNKAFANSISYCRKCLLNRYRRGIATLLYPVNSCYCVVTIYNSKYLICFCDPESRSCCTKMNEKHFCNSSSCTTKFL